MKIPIGIFFGGATPARDLSFQTAQRVFQQLDRGSFEPLAFLVDPFGQLILLETGMPSRNSISDFYPSGKYFSATESAQFPTYPEQLGPLGATEQAAMANAGGTLISFADLPQYISIAFLALPDVSELQESLHEQRIPYTGELAEFANLCADRVALRMQLQQLGYELPAALRLTAADWRENSLQAIWGEDSASVAYPLLLRPAQQHQAGRSAVVTAKDGPDGLRRAIDQAFGQRRLLFEDWLDMSPVDRENFVRYLAQWPSGIGFPLDLQIDKLTIQFQRPLSLLDYLNKLNPESTRTTLLFRSKNSGDEILVSSLPEGTAISALVLRDPQQIWKVSDLRFLGGAPAIVTGTENAATAGPQFKIAESLQQQLRDACCEVAGDLAAETGIRVIGVLAADGQLIPEEVQVFAGQEKAEKLSAGALKSFIIASLKARQAQNADPLYRSLITTLSNAEILPEPESAQPVFHEAPQPVQEEKEVPLVKKVTELKTTSTTTRQTPPPPVMTPPAPKVDENVYKRELERLNKEKQVMPETVSVFKGAPQSSPGPKPKEGLWSSIKAFFSSRLFWRNAGALALFLVLFFLLVNIGLRVYTKHGDSMQLEDYQGLLLEEAERKAAAKGLKIEVISASFQPGKRPNEIFDQYPEPLSKVKDNRTIFVTIYHNEGRDVMLPAFTEVGDDIETYRRELRKRKIDMVIRDQVFDGKLAEGTILYLLIKGEKITNTELAQGNVVVTQGTEVEAVISTRVSSTVEMPDLVCKRFDAASFQLTAINLVVGKVYGGADGNRNEFYVWKQEPEFAPGKLIDKGSQINLYLTPIRPDDCPGGGEE